MSKHLLLLRSVLITTTRRHPDTYAAADLATGFGLLSEIQGEEPELAAEVIGLPQFGAWAFHCLTELDRPVPHPGSVSALGRLNAFAALAGIRSGREFELRVPVRDGLLSVPTLGALILPSSGPSWAVLRHRPGGTTATLPGRSRPAVPLPGPESAHRPAPGWRPVGSIADAAAGIPVSLRVDPVDPLLGALYRGAAGHRRAEGTTRWTALFGPAWRLLARHHSDYAAAVAAGLDTIVPLVRPPTGRASGTSARAFGAIAMSPPEDAVTFAESLVHEFQHVLLGALHDLAPFTDGTEAAGRAHHYVPWRSDPRPLDALLNGCFAYTGVTEFWRRVRGHLPEPYVGELEFARWRSAVGRTLDGVADSDSLSPAGRRLVRAMRATAETWRTERVSAGAQRAADALNADHRLTWLHEQPAAVQRP